MTEKNFSAKDARHVCETVLRSSLNDKIEKAILPNEVEVIEQLLSRGLELEGAYCEIQYKLKDHPNALSEFFNFLMNTAAVSSPNANQEARKGRARLVQINCKIEKMAMALASLLNERITLRNQSGLSCGTFYHPADAIHAAAAAAENHNDRQWVKKRIDAVAGQFDFKYWPSLSEVVKAIADDAARAAPLPHDPVIEAGTSGDRGSLADSFRAFFAELEESNARNYGPLPLKFELTDRSVASLMSCALGLDADNIVDSSYVKRLRQRRRERSAKK